MDEYISGFEVANAIADDDDFFRAYVQGKLTPYHEDVPQPFEGSCLTCKFAIETGMPDPHKCDTDPDPEDHPVYVEGCFRHESCGFSPVIKDEDILERLKSKSFLWSEFERFMENNQYPPLVPGASFESTLVLTGKYDFSKNGVLSEKKVEDICLAYLWRMNVYKKWKRTQVEVVQAILGKSIKADAARKIFQRRVKPLIE